MKGPIKKVLLIVAIVALLGGAFYGGVLYAGQSSPAGRGDFAGGQAPDGSTGGPMSSMTDEEQAAFDAMTDEEKQAYLEEQGMAGGGDRTGGPTRGGALEGEVVEVADDTITVALTDGGSQTVYTDDDTVIGYAEGAGELAAGSEVWIYSESETDGVTTAQAVLVQ